MKSFDDIEKSVRKKAADRLTERNRRRITILRSLAICTGATAVLGIGLTTYILKPPKKPAPSQSGIIVETETTSAETTVAPTSPSTTAPKTTATNQITTVIVSTTVTTSSARQTATAAYTIVTATRTTRTAVTTTAATSPMTTTAAQTTESNIPEFILEITGGDAPMTTTFMQATTPSVTTVTSQDSAVYERMIAQDFKNISLNGMEYTRDTTVISAEYTDEFIGELTLEPTVYTDELPSQITAKVYSIRDIEPDKLIAVLCEGSKKYRVYKCAEYSAAELAEYISYIKEHYVT